MVGGALAMAIAASSVNANAAEADSVAKPTLAESAIAHVAPHTAFHAEVFANPSMQSFHHAASLNNLRVGYDYRHATQPMQLEQGDGHSEAFAAVDAYLHKGKATLWGKAEYRNGSTRNIHYCETSDYMLLYPYLMADTVGGSSHRERYYFMGGFSYAVGKWNIAAEGGYTALMEYRTRDPRPKNLSGDLRAKVGASYHLSPLRLLGVAITARRYKQTNEVEIYNEVSMPTIYHLTGLGNDYYRFRGDYMDSYYKGYGLGGMITYAQTSQRGLFAHLEYEYTNIDNIISSLNELPMTTLSRHQQQAAVGYTGGSHTDQFGVKLTEAWSKRIGTENIFGTAQDNIYPQISAMNMYRQTTLQTAVQALYEHTTTSKAVYGARWSVGYGSYEEKYLEPERRMKSSVWNSSLMLDAHATLGKLLCSGQLQGIYTWAGSNHVGVSADDQSATFFAPIAHYYRYLADNRWQTTATAEICLTAFSRFLPYIRVDWQYNHYLQTEHTNHLQVAMGIKF